MLLTEPYYSRFGIYPKAKPSDEDPAVGRSLITPTIDENQAVADSWGEAESWQSYVFGGPTTKEVSRAVVGDSGVVFYFNALKLYSPRS